MRLSLNAWNDYPLPHTRRDLHAPITCCASPAAAYPFGCLPPHRRKLYAPPTHTRNHRPEQDVAIPNYLDTPWLHQMDMAFESLGGGR